ncbi:ogdh-2, partial [Pristionchus pacificus]
RGRMLRAGRNLVRISSRGYRPGKDQYGWLPDPPKSAWTPQGEMNGETAQRVHLVNAFRRFGYLEAELDPLGLAKTRDMPELSPETYGLKWNASLNEKHSVDDLVDQLRSIYCGPLAIEFMHISNWEERDWLARHFESTISSELRTEERVKLAKTMVRVENFDHFLATKFATVKRYGCEGAEAMFGFFTELFDSAPERGTEQIMLCIAHRGRLNLLTELMQFPTVQMFRKMRGKPEFPSDVQGSGDVLSHLTSSFDHSTPDGSVHITMLPNPSHLEAINPVAMGKARARAATLKKGEYSKEKDARSGDGVLCVQVHGDGAFSGQGVVWETLALSQVPHFRTGGSIHLVTNNQVAFTAEGHVGRSTTHCTDIAKAIDCPVIHVNGDNPEEVVAATRLALDYRNKFRKDVFVNMICFRRWGHNELDDPSFTQPLMYKAIESRRSVPTEYTERLIMEGVITKEEIENEKKAHTDKLLESFRAIETTPPVANHLSANWTGMGQAPPSIERWDTGVDLDVLRFVGAASVQTKDGFELHPHLKKTHVETRLAKLTSGEGIDWATAEALAVGSLLTEGVDVRFSGQDVGRGTFCHRHAMLVDQNTDECFIPLNSIHEGQKAFYEVANNLLSEEAILGFEFGYSLDSPRRLCVWEAQFGDFFNGAQIMIDTFIASAESKWLTQSGLTMLLPHGFDGAGPEHSSCRMERFLQLCDSREDQTPVDGENVNIRIANPTTSAQYFHLLRRQVVPNYRKPLIVVGPKILLRHPQAASTLAEFAPGTSFQNVINEKKEGTKIEKVIFVSGKHWITVDKARKERGLDEKVAIVRVESLCPFPVADLQSTLELYPNAKSFVWSQEEPRNAGAWSFVNTRFENAVGVKLKYAGRRELAHTATAIGQFHSEENEAVIRDTFE